MRARIGNGVWSFHVLADLLACLLVCAHSCADATVHGNDKTHEGIPKLEVSAAYHHVLQFNLLRKHQLPFSNSDLQQSWRKLSKIVRDIVIEIT